MSRLNEINRAGVTRPLTIGESREIRDLEQDEANRASIVRAVSAPPVSSSRSARTSAALFREAESLLRQVRAGQR
jgi:hypothetical protein